jgi:hemerythrin-like metal-binding protein
MPLIKWSDIPLTNIEHIDNEHKGLVELLNKLHDVVSQDQGKEFISPALMELIRYAKTHFKHEEDFMKMHDYSDVDAHHQAHIMFISKVADFKKKYDNHEMSTLIPILTFVSRWIIEHISQVDQKYAKELGMK